MNEKVENTAQGGAVKSADRVLDVLELIARGRRRLSHSEIASALGIPKSSLTNLLRNLTDRGYLAFDGATKLFLLGPAVAALGRQSHGPLLTTLGQSILADLTRETDESSGIYIMNGLEVERIAGQNSEQALLYSMTVNKRFPAYAVSTGKVILAHLPEEEREAYFENVKFRKVTPHTLNESDFRRQLPQVLEEGFGYSLEEGTVGISGIAVPILDPLGYPVAAITVVLPAIRYDEGSRRCVQKALTRARAQLEAGLRG